MSSHIRARKHKANQIATLVTLAFPAAAFAQQTVTLPEVKVEAQAEAPYKATNSANSKYTQPLVDTPQTIQVIKKEVFLEQGASTLMEALRNTPGLTSQVGENGASTAGDNFTMRGVSSSQNSLFVDGIRDMGAITRDIYNLEQVEIVKGPAGGDIGRGAGAGYVNLISKLPSLENATSGSLSINTGNLKRGTIDINRKLDDTMAVRVNAMTQDGGVAGRDYVENTGWAFAPSIAIGLGTPTRVYAYAQFIRQDNIPDNGIPAIGNAGYARTTQTSPLTGAAATPAATAALLSASKVDRDNFYGSVNDYERINASQATLKVEHDLAGGGTVRNITRMGKTATVRLSHSPFLIFPNATGSTSTFTDSSTWTTSLSNQGLDQTNEILANQTSLNKTVTAGSFTHDLSIGLELMSERQRTNTMSSTGLTTVYSNLYNPNPYLAMPMAYKNGAFTDGKTDTVAMYASDTIKLSPAWQVNAGLRSEYYSTTTVASTLSSPLKKDGWLHSWKTGVVYKPAANGSIYAAVANSMTPPGGGNFALSATSSNASSPYLDPQEALNKELGTKWDFFDRRLGITAAYYQTSIKNELPILDASTGTYYATGDREVSGFELSAIGALTDRWSVSAALATMDTKVKSGTTGDNSAGTAARYSPELTGTLWATYNTGLWSAGVGARGSTPQVRVVSGSTTNYSLPELPGYVVFDAMASYQVSKNVNLRLNVYNLGDKYYIASTNGNGQANSGGRIVLGAPLSATLTASFQF